MTETLVLTKEEARLILGMLQYVDFISNPDGLPSEEESTVWKRLDEFVEGK